MKNIQIISDKNKKSLKIKSILLKILKKSEVKKSNIIIVIGGDGFMLQTLKKNNRLSNLFYGINSGNYGFLMNKFSKKNLFDFLFFLRVWSMKPSPPITITVFVLSILV